MKFLGFITILSLTATASAKGINCEGSSQCGFFAADGMKKMVKLINSIDEKKHSWANNGQQIACVENQCAFLQKTGGAPISSIKTLITELYDHGCDGCGSIPLFYPGDNNVNNGELTVNWAGRPCTGDGGLTAICPAFR
ncbi:related to KP4 killer toxin [Fusarium torulosum]|uniref:Related to KP4 killer toxin n=1 Tax=Fusarium torulosum TaxID=33205 RepID=A0AAE8MNF2_9HYPO|nr:related to KP4 killer toxin [Fusarium torulosum]